VPVCCSVGDDGETCRGDGDGVGSDRCNVANAARHDDGEGEGEGEDAAAAAGGPGVCVCVTAEVEVDGAAASLPLLLLRCISTRNMFGMSNGVTG